MKLESGLEVEYRSLTWKERRTVSAQMAQYIQDNGKIIESQYDMVNFAVTKIDGEVANESNLIKLDNNDIREVTDLIMEVSNFSKKK